MARANVFAGGLLTLFALYFIYESLKLPLWSNVGPGTGALPLGCGVLFAALSLTLVIRNLREGSAQAGTVDFSRWRAPVLILGGVFVGALVVKTLGMLIVLFFLMAFLTGVVGRAGWRKALLSAAATAGSFYLIFEVWLGVPLVIGVLGI